MYKIIPNIKNEFNYDTDILTSQKYFLIRYDSKEEKQEAINKIFSSIVTFAHNVVNKLHSTYIGVNILKDIINLLIKDYNINKIIFSDFVSDYYKMFSNENVFNTIKENLTKEFDVSIDKIDNILNKNLLLKTLSPSISKTDMYTFYKEINNFDFISTSFSNDLELYSRKTINQFEIEDNHYVVTNKKCTPFSLKTDININENKIAIFNDSIISFNFIIDLNNYLSKEQIEFIILLNSFMDKYSDIPMLSKVSDPMELPSNIEDINKLLDSIVEKIKQL